MHPSPPTAAEVASLAEALSVLERLHKGAFKPPPTVLACVLEGGETCRETTFAYGREQLKALGYEKAFQLIKKDFLYDTIREDVPCFLEATLLDKNTGMEVTKFTYTGTPVSEYVQINPEGWEDVLDDVARLRLWVGNPPQSMQGHEQPVVLAVLIAVGIAFYIVLAWLLLASLKRLPLGSTVLRLLP